VQQLSQLFDLVGEHEQRRWDVEADRLGSPKIYRQCHLGRKLEWKTAGSIALENPIHELSRRGGSSR
jgi:hypothetical protein